MSPVHFPQKFNQLNQPGKRLLVFLRHSGCPFCKQTLQDVSHVRDQIEEAGAEIVLVHMMTDENKANQFFSRYSLDDVQAISDPDCEVYGLLGLRKGKLNELLGPVIWAKGAMCTLWEGHLPGKPQGDMTQLGGAVLIEDGEIRQSHLCKNSADRPDYAAIAGFSRSHSQGQFTAEQPT